MLDRIRASLSALSPAEQRVAELVLSDPRLFAASPVAELAERAQVSKPTVVRFCRSVGYSGLADFKLKLAGAVVEGVPYVHRAVDEGDATPELTVKIIDNTVSALLKLRHEAPMTVIDTAVVALTEAVKTGRRIVFFGVGNSAFVAQDAQHKFFRLGVSTAAHNDAHVQIMAATLLVPGDCAVFISNSGRSRDMLEAAEVARRSGATLVAITSRQVPLGRLVQHAIEVDHPEDYTRYSPMVSRLLHLTVIDILSTGVALRLGPAWRPPLEDIKKNLGAKRYAPAP